MLGVLGGMGPMATVDFLAKLVRATPAARDQDHIPTLVCSAADIPDRTAAILGHGIDPLPAMQTALRRLEAAGATRITIPCNTAHHWHAALQARTAIPILHIVDAVAETLASAGVTGPVGLLASDGTLLSGLYPQRFARHDLVCRMPDPAGQGAVMEAIRRVKAGDDPDAGPSRAAALLAAQAETLLSAGCARVVMACTEIPLALAGVGTLRDRLVDATDALARACVAACTGAVPVAMAA